MRGVSRALGAAARVLRVSAARSCCPLLPTQTWNKRLQIVTVRQCHVHDAASSSNIESVFQDSTFRNKMCSDIDTPLIGETVIVAGWVRVIRSLGGIVFGVVRDSSGEVQLYLPHTPASDSLCQQLVGLSTESVISVTGVIQHRPENQVTDTPTGKVELHVSGVKVLNAARVLPFSPSEASPGEEVRMRYRYLDLRRPYMQTNLMIRAKAAAAARAYLGECGFTEIETPTLFRSTPEGAREFLVPTRSPGKFYALVQSPQQYKQMLMASGINRYYQFARCYRDESGRADRQPEFTQIDMEMSFVDTHHVHALIEQLVVRIVQHSIGIHIPTPFPKMTFDDAIKRYGSDKPDRRWGMELEHPDVSVFSSPLVVAALQKHATLCQTVATFLVPGFGSVSRADLTALLQAATPHPNDTVLFLKREGGGFVNSGAAAKMTQEEKNIILCAHPKSASGDLIVVVAGGEGVTGGSTTAGRLRLACAASMQTQHNVTATTTWDPFWVVDFPLFREPEERLQGVGNVEAVHHPFTAPKDMHEGDVAVRSGEGLAKLVSKHYDLVMDGMELGGGSIRIHDAAMQRRVLELIVGDPDIVQQRFGHLLEVLGSGCPPHGGIAIGFDRLVSLLCGCRNIRDVIAFPKTATGQELLTGSPAEATAEQLREYHIVSTRNE